MKSEGCLWSGLGYGSIFMMMFQLYLLIGEIMRLKQCPTRVSKFYLFVLSWQGERGRHRDGSRANQRPTKTLFVINFDPLRTRVRDIEKHFEPYGKVLHVRIRRNFAFVQFETQEDATKALECTNMR